MKINVFKTQCHVGSTVCHTQTKGIGTVKKGGCYGMGSSR